MLCGVGGSTGARLYHVAKPVLNSSTLDASARMIAIGRILFIPHLPSRANESIAIRQFLRTLYHFFDNKSTPFRDFDQSQRNTPREIKHFRHISQRKFLVFSIYGWFCVSICEIPDFCKPKGTVKSVVSAILYKEDNVIFGSLWNAKRRLKLFLKIDLHFLYFMV